MKFTHRIDIPDYTTLHHNHEFAACFDSKEKDRLLVATILYSSFVFSQLNVYLQGLLMLSSLFQTIIASTGAMIFEPLVVVLGTMYLVALIAKVDLNPPVRLSAREDAIMSLTLLLSSAVAFYRWFSRRCFYEGLGFCVLHESFLTPERVINAAHSQMKGLGFF